MRLVVQHWCPDPAVNVCVLVQNLLVILSGYLNSSFAYDLNHCTNVELQDPFWLFSFREAPGDPWEENAEIRLVEVLAAQWVEHMRTSCPFCRLTGGLLS